MLPLAISVAGCDRGDRQAAADGGASAGERIERAARGQGIVPDPQTGRLTGVWARDADRMCVVDGGSDGPAGAQRIGIVTDFGDGQGCIAQGTIGREGERLRIMLGRCRFDARLDAGRVVFPDTVPPACARLCRGRASLAGLDMAQQSMSASEAAMLRSRGGRMPCAVKS